MSDKGMLDTTLAVTTSILFAMGSENDLWEKEVRGEILPGTYERAMLAQSNVPLRTTNAIDYIRKVSNAHNHHIVLFSRNNAVTGMRALRTLLNEGITPSRFIFTNGASPVPYLPIYGVNRFLTTNEADAIGAHHMGIATAHYENFPSDFVPEFLDSGSEIPTMQPDYVKATKHYDKIIHVYDFDGVLADLQSEEIFQRHGLEAFNDNERAKLKESLQKGTHWEQFKREIHDPDTYEVHIVTSRGSIAAFRLFETLYEWNLVPNGEIHCVNGMDKAPVIASMRDRKGNHLMFYDDSRSKIDKVRRAGIPAGQVPQISKK